MRRLVALVTGAVMLMGAASCSLDLRKSSMTKADDSDVKKLIGEWQVDEKEGAIIAIESSSSAWIGAAKDYSSYMHFEPDGSFIYDGETYAADQYTFSGGEFELSTPDGNDVSMKKIDGDNDSVYGEYELSGGDVYRSLSKAYKAKMKKEGDDSNPKDMHIGLECVGQQSEIKIKFPADIEIYGDTMFIGMKLSYDIADDMNIGSCTYKVVGDKLYLSKSDNTKLTLRRRAKIGEETAEDGGDFDTAEPDPDDYEDQGEFIREKMEREKASLDKKIEEARERVSRNR